MRSLSVIAVAAALAVSACAEITTFRRADDSAYHYIDCDATPRVFETCAMAARRTCPDGYHRLDIEPRPRSDADRSHTTCLNENSRRATQGLAPLVCTKPKRNDGFFECDRVSSPERS